MTNSYLDEEGDEGVLRDLENPLTEAQRLAASGDKQAEAMMAVPIFIIILIFIVFTILIDIIISIHHHPY